ncbi:MAG TPA: 4Fe-4S dicluster domain-containing protein [Candidatus Binataceae bacterium]|nr:4Fe-4S dicluster domain-containing protein [Candidatus Binataceae bacterium]
MATIITSECINCGACEPECPNTAIYAGGVEWEHQGAKHPAIAQDIFYIVPSKCTECVGFYDHEACAAVCPVDCCVPDPNNVETEAVLLARARELHADKTFADDAPSRFRKEGGGAEAPAAGGEGASAANGAAAAAKPAPAAAPAAKPSPAPAAASMAVAAPLAMLNLPKDVGALPGPIEEKHFPGEIDGDFETVMASVDAVPVKSAPVPVEIALRLAEPVLGAMPDSVKRDLENAVGNPAGFSRIRSTALNLILNLIMYPVVLGAFCVAVRGDLLFSQETTGWVLLGVLAAGAEAAFRLREGIFEAKPAGEMTYRGSWYGIVLAPLGAILARAGGGGRRSVERKVAFDGYEIPMHDDKTERDRRYGTVYTVAEYANAYLVRLEMPRKLPQSSLKRLWNLPDEMPDYDYNVMLGDGVLTISASVRGEALRRLSYVSSSFPADFTTRIEFGKPVATFRHRLHGKVLDIIVMKGEAAELQNAA